MEKRALLGGLIILLILTTFSVLQAQTASEEQEKVDDAYACLIDRVDDRCASLSTEEKIFTVLSANKCKAELITDSSNNGECWPDPDCEIKTTAQAVLALDNVGVNTALAEAWLLSQNQTTTELFWYLEIESSEATTCTINYAGVSSNINIGEDKKISNNAGSCLVRAQDNYWLRISPTCYDHEFEISCNQKFLTTLLFRKSGSSTIYVSQDSSSASAGGITTEKVESLCFAENNACDYEDNLWASLVLDSLGEDISSYLPYLITLAEDNPRLLPEAFLYFITGDTQYKNSLLSEQKNNQWWMESGDKFYDTALALYPFQNENIQEKTDSKEWLLEIQDSSGCWDENNVKNTGFILASLWPRDFGDGNGVNGGLPDCEDAGFYCTSTGNCEGDIFAEYECTGLSVCCSIPPIQETCGEQNGQICSSNQRCSGGDTISTADLLPGETCCVRGSCIAAPPASDCELNAGTCRTYGCNDNEEEATYSCGFAGDTCCILKTKRGGGTFWIWFFLILIVLVVIGIIFRDKLRNFLFRIKSGKSRRRPGPGPRPGPRPPPRPIHREPIPERRILLPAQEPARRPVRRGRSKTEKELDTVLKKLKDLGK